MRKAVISQQILPLLIILFWAFTSCIPQNVGPLPTPPPSPPSPESHPIDTTPPETIITSAPTQTIDHNEVTFKWTGSDDNTPAANLTYSYYLEGYDTDYSPFTSNTSKICTNLTNGSYIFYVKSKDEAANVDPTPATYKFIVALAPTGPSKPEIPTGSSPLILISSEVNRLAIGADGKTIYVLDSINAHLYKSDSSGYGWINISGKIAGAAPWNELAIAPDNPNTVAVATNSGTEIYLSVDGGANFHATNLTGKLGAGERIRCVAISSAFRPATWEIAVGTSTGNGGGRVWIITLSSFPSGWRDMSTGVSGWLSTSPKISGVDVFAVRYSPGFDADGTILAIVASRHPPDSDDTYLYIGIKDLASNTMTWNPSPGYPVEICQLGQDTPGTPLTYADIALPSDYSGGIPPLRHVYACWSDNPPGVATAGNANDDVYRIDDTICYRVHTGPDVICSLAYYGMHTRGKLLAGAMMSSSTIASFAVQTYFTPNPESLYPTWRSSLKPPTGRHEARVAWSPDGRIAYCGTSSIGGAGNDESALSHSLNNGLTWNQ